MGAVKEPKKFKILHYVAHSCGGEALGHAAGQGARADRPTGGEIALNHAAKDLAGAVIEFSQ
jgi:hypothetical protein